MTYSSSYSRCDGAFPSTILQNGQSSTSSHSGWSLRPSNCEIWKLVIFAKVRLCGQRMLPLGRERAAEQSEWQSCQLRSKSWTRQQPHPGGSSYHQHPGRPPTRLGQYIRSFEATTSMTHKDETAIAHAHDVPLNPRTKGYEFFGPFGALFVSTSVPILTYVFSLQCSEPAGGCPRSWVELPTEFKMAVTNPDWWKSLWDAEAFLVYLGWYSFCLIAWAVLPGDWVEGQQLRNGKKLKYKINGKLHRITNLRPGAHFFSFIIAFSTYLLALGLAIGVIVNFGPSSFTYIHDHWIGFVTAALINSVVQAFVWYAWSFRPGHLLALGGNTGNHLYDVRQLVCP